MELENLSSSNNDLTNDKDKSNGQTSSQGNRSANQQDQTASPKAIANEGEADKDANSPSNAKTGNNVDANHCARNFFCWCCSCCSCLK